MRFPDAEDVVMGLLSGIAPTNTATPNPIDQPMIRVNRIGGADDYVTDFPRVEVACYAPYVDGDATSGRVRCWQMAEACRDAIYASRRTLVITDLYPSGVLVDNAVTVTPATQVPYADPAVSRVTALYRFAFRRTV